MLFRKADFEKVNILVVGDIMLDQYWHGDTSRISPESPVPVVHVKRVVEGPGGASNVALNVAALGAKVTLLGLVGEDTAANTLRQALTMQGVEHELISVQNYSTITKLRVLSRHQQMIRLDTEEALTDDAALNTLKSYYEKALSSADLVILSDYHKGALSQSAELIKLARLNHVPVIVDPKLNDYTAYQNANIITPNLKEFEAVVGRCATADILIQKANQLLKKHALDALIITRGEEGLSIVTESGEVTHIPSIVREVHDVTGAGDTVIAALGTALASGLSLVDAATLGNIAAGIAVGKLGAVTVSIEELEKALGHHVDLPLGVVGEEQLLSAIKMARANGERIVFTNGCFDILHAGHVMYLEQARRLGDRVIIGVNDDASVRRLKGETRPINGVIERMQVLAGLRSVDWVVPFSEDTPERLIKAISPDVLVKGGDYQDINALPGASFVLSQGGTVKILGLKEGLSTTRIIETVEQTRYALNVPDSASQ